MKTTKCSKCGSEYELTYNRVLARDKDSIDCEVCGERNMYSWNEAKIWSARLISKKEDHLRK